MRREARCLDVKENGWGRNRKLGFKELATKRKENKMVAGTFKMVLTFLYIPPN